MYPAGASTRMGGLIVPMLADFVVGSVPLMLPNLQGKTSDKKRQMRHYSAIPRGIVYLATNATKLWKKRKERHLAGWYSRGFFAARCRISLPPCLPGVGVLDRSLWINPKRNRPSRRSPFSLSSSASSPGRSPCRRPLKASSSGAPVSSLKPGFSARPAEK